MSVEPIEEEISRLQAMDLARLTEWFADYLASGTSNPGGTAKYDRAETPEQIAELERRLSEFKAEPVLQPPSSRITSIT
jgi:hypothetical protein